MGLLWSKLYLYLGVREVKKTKKPWCNPLGKVHDEFRCSASAVRITKLWAQWRNNMGSNVGWAERESADWASAELKQLGAWERGEGNISMKNPPDWFYFLINESDSLWIRHGNHPRRACALWTNSMCVNVATYTRTYCIRKCVWRWKKCTC